MRPATNGPLEEEETLEEEEEEEEEEEKKDERKKNCENTREKELYALINRIKRLTCCNDNIVWPVRPVLTLL